jgi:predicted transcriptional regulator
MPAADPPPANQPAANARQSLELTDPRALRAVAHPLRLQLIGLLRDQGPLTATQAGRRLGESAQSCWFHLRQLAKYGLVEEAGGGRGRERPWRATAMTTIVPRVAATPEMAAATELLMTVLAEQYFEDLMRWLSTRAGEPPQWQQAAIFGDSLLYLTAEELTTLNHDLRALIDRYQQRAPNPALRPPGARPVTFLRLAFPQQGPRHQDR